MWNLPWLLPTFPSDDTYVPPRYVVLNWIWTYNSRRKNGGNSRVQDTRVPLCLRFSGAIDWWELFLDYAILQYSMHEHLSEGTIKMLSRRYHTTLLWWCRLAQIRNPEIAGEYCPVSHPAIYSRNESYRANLEGNPKTRLPKRSIRNPGKGGWPAVWYDLLTISPDRFQYYWERLNY